MEEQRRIFEYMPQFGPHYSAHGGVRCHPDGVRIDPVTAKVAIERPAGADGRQPQAKAKSAYGKMSDVNKGIHGCVVTYSIAGVHAHRDSWKNVANERA